MQDKLKQIKKHKINIGMNDNTSEAHFPKAVNGHRQMSGPDLLIIELLCHLMHAG